MKALPARLAGAWQQAKCDPEGKVEYQLTPLSARLFMLVGGQFTKEVGVQPDGSPLIEIDGVAGAALNLALSLSGLRGLLNADGTEFKLEHEKERIAGKKYPRVTDECLDRLPAELYQELYNAAAEALDLSPQEKQGLDFTPPSAEQELAAMGTSLTVPTAAPMDFCT